MQNTGRGSCHHLGALMPLSPCHHCCCFPMPATSPCHPWPYCSQFPPNEQLLAAVVGGAVVVVAILVPVFPS